jgi:RecA-family ATPase
MLEMAVAIATGREVLGTTPDRPRRVLYVDFENDPRSDVRERLQAMGYKPADLDNLAYLSFPTLAALDSERGGLELMAVVEEYACEVVVIDTVSRAVKGEENENDTWLDFYRHTGLKLKQAEVALIRLDHAGKDETKGQRGGSAKVGDVDAVWRLWKVADDVFRLECEANRMPVTEKALTLHREKLPYLHHRVDADARRGADDAKVAELVRLFDSLGIDPSLSRVGVLAVLKQAGKKGGRHDLMQRAIESRRTVVIGGIRVPTLGDTPQTAMSPNDGDTLGHGEGQ